MRPEPGGHWSRDLCSPIRVQYSGHMIILDQSETTHGTPSSSPTHTLSRPGLNFPKPLITCMLDLYRCTNTKLQEGWFGV